MSAGTAWAQLAIIHTVDTGGVGQYTSVAYGTDGLPLISYYDVANGDLKVAHCLDVGCAASTKQTIDSAGDVGRHTAIAIGADGRGIVSYVDVTNGRLKVAHCNDVACNSATTVTLTNVGPAGAGTDIAIAGGIPTIAFRDLSVLRVARCVDAVCSDATATSYAGGGNNPTVTIGGNGLPLVAHDNGSRIFLGRCQDAACTAASFLTICPNPGPGEGAFLILEYFDPSLAVGPDGRGVLAFVRRTTTPILTYFDVLLARCADTGCSALVTPAVTFPASPVVDPRVAIASDDVPFAAWTRSISGVPYLEAVPCRDASCGGAVPEVFAGPGAGTFPDLAPSPAGRALVAFHDATLGWLMTAYFDGNPYSDLTVTAFDSPDPVAPTQTLTYGIAAQNQGPNTAQAAVTSIALPPGVTFVTASGGCAYEPVAHKVTCPPQTIPTGPAVKVGTVGVRVPPNLPGPLNATVSIAGANPDPNPGNNSTAVSTATTLGLRIVSPAVIEGHSGVRDCRFDVMLLDDGNGVPQAVTIFYGTGGGTATAGIDYLPSAGPLTFASGSTQTVRVGIVGDLLQEQDEMFFLQISLPLGVQEVSNPPATIVDDDVTPVAPLELSHGSWVWADLRGPLPPEDLFRVVVPGRSSFEVAIDAASGDVPPLALERLNAGGTAVLQSGGPTGTGSSVSLRWQNTLALPVANQLIRVRSGGCATDCGPDDVYRARAWETTARIPRFNNTATQATVLILQNPSDHSIAGTVYYWSGDGLFVTTGTFTLGPRALSVVNTAVLVPAQSGSITISHDAPYGVLQGKAVAIEPATGFSFDSPLVYRPR